MLRYKEIGQEFCDKGRFELACAFVKTGSETLKVLNAVKEKGYKIVMIHARDVVIPFYLKCGYRIADEGFEEVGIPHHKMEKQLP